MTDSKSMEMHQPTELEARVQRLDDLITRTDKEDPDPEDLALIRKILRKSDLWQRRGDLAKVARKIVIEELPQSAFGKESVRVAIDHIQNGMGYESAPMLERLLIDQVVISWLRHYQVELDYSGMRLSGPVTLHVATYYERRLSAAQGRFLRACATLARIRKMAGRTPGLMQLNIGAQQVNVAQVSED